MAWANWNPEDNIDYDLFFDLVATGYYLIADIVDTLPMTMQNAPASSFQGDREFGAIYGKTDGILSAVLYYDLRDKVRELDAIEMKALSGICCYCKALYKGRD